MSAAGAGPIGPVSVRYAAQIRELLHAQAMQRIAADQEAARARAEAERTARTQAAAKAEQSTKPLHARIEPQAPAPVAQDKPKPEAKPTVDAPHIIDIQA